MSDPTEEDSSNSFSLEYGNYNATNENIKLDDEDYQKKLFGKEFWVHPNKQAKSVKHRNWFVAPNEQKFGKQGYVDNPHAKVPKKVGELSSGYKEAETYMEQLIAFGEIWFGARYDLETNKFDIAVGRKAYNSFPTFSRHIDSYAKSIKEQKKKMRGWSSDNITKLKQIVEAFNAEPSDKPKSAYETRAEKGTGEDVSELQQMSLIQKKDFYKADDEVVQKFSDYLVKTTKKSDRTTESLINYLYTFLAINGRSEHPTFLTTGLTELYSNDRFKMEKELNEMLAIYDHFATEYYTPPAFWTEKWESEEPFEEKEYDGMPISFADAKVFLPTQYNKKLQRKRYWDEQEELWGDAGHSATQAVRMAVASFIRAPVVPNSWGLSPQQRGMPFFRAVLKLEEGKTKAGELGFEVARNPDEVAIGLKFLETGIIHEFIIIGTKKGKTLNKTTGTVEDIDVPIRKLVKAKNPMTGEIDVIENHYNPSLSIYKMWGVPYGKFAPANMFMRLALSGTGWRKSEGLTAQTKALKDGKTKQLSGIFLDIENNLNLKFMTRKGFKWNNLTHSSVLPAMSSTMFQNRHTFELIMQKANFGKFKSNDPDSEDYYEVERNLSQAEKEANNPELTVLGYHYQKGKAVVDKKKILYHRDAGETPITLIGLPNQFLPVERLENIGHKEQEYKVDPVTDEEYQDPLTGKEKYNDMSLKAFFYFPLKEMYTVMEHTGTKIRTVTEMKKEIEKDRKTHLKGIDRTLSKKEIEKKERAFKEFKMDEMGFAVGEVWGKAQRAKLKQDMLRYTGVDSYWRKKPMHAVRHLFAQIWLKQSGWNFGLVADFGHWSILDTLKVNYGDAPDTQMANAMIQLWSETEDLAEKEKLQKLLKLKIKDAQAQATKQEIEPPPKAVLKAVSKEDGADDAEDKDEDEPEEGEASLSIVA